MKNGFVCRVMLAVKPAAECLLAMVALANCYRTIDINKLYQKLRHASKALMQKMAKLYGWMLKNQFETCESCALTKSHQKDTNKEKKAQSKTPGKHWFIYISHNKSQSFGSLQYWLLCIDDAMDFSSILLLKLKDQMLQAMILHIKRTLWLRNNCCEEALMQQLRWECCI